MRNYNHISRPPAQTLSRSRGEKPLNNICLALSSWANDLYWGSVLDDRHSQMMLNFWQWWNEPPSSITLDQVAKVRCHMPQHRVTAGIWNISCLDCLHTLQCSVTNLSWEHMLEGYPIITIPLTVCNLLGFSTPLAPCQSNWPKTGVGSNLQTASPPYIGTTNWLRLCGFNSRPLSLQLHPIGL